MPFNKKQRLAIVQETSKDDGVVFSVYRFCKGQEPERLTAFNSLFQAVQYIAELEKKIALAKSFRAVKYGLWLAFATALYIIIHLTFIRSL